MTLLRLVLLCLGLSVLFVPAAQAASIGTLKEYRLPTSTDPHDATTSSDGNVWFTVQGAFNEETFETPGQVAQVTPRGDITELDVCPSCIPNDIVQGPDGILYVSDNGGQLRRITTSGEPLTSIPVGDVSGDPIGGLAADSTSIWFADPFNSRIGRYNVFTAEFTFYPAAGVDDLAVATDGTVWFTGSDAIGELDPALGVVSTTPLSGDGTAVAIAPDGTVWVTELFADLIARLTPNTTGTHQLVEFATAANAGPLGIAAAGDGSVWFTQNLRGNIARISSDGVITEASKPVDFSDPKRPDPIGITIGANGDPWYAESLVDKVATLKLR
jgi:virginiamycin B lyase